MTQLSGEEVKAALYCLNDLIARRRLAGRGAPTEVERLHRRLSMASVCGSETSPTAAELEDDDLVDTSEAADILRCSPRWVREIHNDLDGARVGGRWVFPRNTVVEYASLKGSW